MRPNTERPGPSARAGVPIRLAALTSAIVLLTGCAGAVAGRAIGTGGTDQPDRCVTGEPPVTVPGPASTPLVRIGWMSPWTPPWTQSESVIVYTDGTAIGPAPERPGDLRVPGTGISTPAPVTAPSSSTGRPSSSSATPTGDEVTSVIPAQQGGWIGDCELRDLVDRVAEIGRTDLGQVTNVMDASSVSITVAAHEGRPAVSISVYALGMGDDDNSDLTADQERSRRQLSAWLTEVTDAIHFTGALPLDRIRLYETTDSIAMVGDDPGHPVAWQGMAPDPQPTSYGRVSCQLLTGDAAAGAVANAERSSAANGHPERRLNGYWGAFTVAGSTHYYALMAAAPGQECR